MYLVLISIFMGSLSDALCSFWTLLVIVAENKKVFLYLGIWVRIKLICFSKSILSSLSASSNTR